MKILLADDTELIREGLKSMLLQLPNPAICRRSERHATVRRR